MFLSTEYFKTKTFYSWQDILNWMVLKTRQRFYCHLVIKEARKKKKQCIFVLLNNVLVDILFVSGHYGHLMVG